MADSARTSTTPVPVRSLDALAGIFRFHLAPELFMRNAAPFSKAPAGGFQDRLQLRRVAHEQALQVAEIPGSPRKVGCSFDGEEQFISVGIVNLDDVIA